MSVVAERLIGRGERTGRINPTSFTHEDRGPVNTLSTRGLVADLDVQVPVDGGKGLIPRSGLLDADLNGQPHPNRGYVRVLGSYGIRAVWRRN